MTATEAFSFVASFESIFISQSDTTDFLSQPLPTGSVRSSLKARAHLGWVSPGLFFTPSFMQQSNSVQGCFSEMAVLCIHWYG